MESPTFIHSLLKGRKKAEPVAAARRRVERSDGTYEDRVETSDEGIHAAFFEKWAPVFQMPYASSSRSQEIMDRVMKEVAADVSRTASGWVAEALSVDAVLSIANIRDAIMALKMHTRPGADGIPCDLYRKFIDSTELIKHLQSLFREILRKGHMPESMREAVVSMLYKDKGERNDPLMYRPVTLTNAVYRILGRAMAQRLGFVLKRFVGDSQIAFQPLRHIAENIELMTEIIRYCENDDEEEGGIAFILDNSQAYDRVQWPFLQATLRAFGVPEDFARLVAAMYTKSTVRLKVNGTLGPAIEVKAGVKQGCPLSCALYVLVQEVLLRMIRSNPDIVGIRIPGADGAVGGASAVTVTERCLADDLMVFLRETTSAKPLRWTLDEFREISGLVINMAKSGAVFFGACRDLPAHVGDGTDLDPLVSCWPDLPAAKYTRFGEKSDKYHGIYPAPPQGVADQWNEKAGELERMASRDAHLLAPRSALGRECAVKSRYLANAMYMWTYQAPLGPARGATLKKVQDTFDGVLGWTGMKKNLQRQPCDEMGLGHVDVAGYLDDVWASRVRDVLRPERRPCKNFWMYGLRQAYGGLVMGKQLLLSNLSFAKVAEMKEGAISETKRCVFARAASITRHAIRQRDLYLVTYNRPDCRTRRAAERLNFVGPFQLGAGR